MEDADKLRRILRKSRTIAVVGLSAQWHRPSYFAAKYMMDAAAIGAKVLWMQLGVRNPEARRVAEAAGLEVVEDHCVKIEHARFFGGLGWAGVNTKVISAKRAT